MRLKRFIFALLILPTLALAQTSPVWVKVATETNTLTVSTVPITVRYGASSGTTTSGVNCATANCWAIVTISKAVTNVSLNDTTCCVLGVPDPAPGVAKELDVQETTAAITVTVSGVAVKVPALTPPPTTTTTYLFTCTATATLANGAPLPATMNLTSASCTAVKQ